MKKKKASILAVVAFIRSPVSLYGFILKCKYEERKRRVINEILSCENFKKFHSILWGSAFAVTSLLFCGKLV